MKTWLGIVFLFLGNFIECHQQTPSSNTNDRIRRQVTALPSSSQLLEEMITLPSKNSIVVRRPLTAGSDQNLFRDDFESRLNLEGSEKIEVTQRAPASGLPDFSVVDTITNEPLEIFDHSSTYPPLDASLVETFLTEPHVQSASQQVIDVRPQPLNDHPKPTIIFDGFDDPIRIKDESTKIPFLNHQNTFFHDTVPVEKFKVFSKDEPNQNSQLTSPIQENRNSLFTGNTLGPTAQKTLHLGLNANTQRGNDFTQPQNVNQQETTPENIQDSADFNFPRINPKIRKPVPQINNLQPFAHQQIIIHQSLPQKVSLLFPGTNEGNLQKGVKAIKFHVPQSQIRKQNNFPVTNLNSFSPGNQNNFVPAKQNNFTPAKFHQFSPPKLNNFTPNPINQLQTNTNQQSLNKIQSSSSLQRNFHALPPQQQNQQQQISQQSANLHQSQQFNSQQNSFSNQQQSQRQQFQSQQQQHQLVSKTVQKQNLREKFQKNQQNNWNNGNAVNKQSDSNFAPLVQKNNNQPNLEITTFRPNLINQQNANQNHNVNNQQHDANNHVQNGNSQNQNVNQHHQNIKSQINLNQQQNSNQQQQQQNTNIHTNTNQQNNHHHQNTNFQPNNNHQTNNQQQQNANFQPNNNQKQQNTNFQPNNNHQINNQQQQNTNFQLNNNHQNKQQNTNFQPNNNQKQHVNFQPNKFNQNNNQQQQNINFQQNTNQHQTALQHNNNHQQIHANQQPNTNPQNNQMNHQQNTNQNQQQNHQISSNNNNNHNSQFGTMPKTATLVFDSRPFTIIQNSLQPPNTRIIEGPSLPTQQTDSQPQFTQEIQVINELPQADEERNEPTAEDPDGDGIIGIAGTHYPTFAHIFHTSFQCKDKPTLPGTYADIEARCQMYHACSWDGSKISFLCSPGTVFNQKYLICDWWYNVDCNNSPDFYNVNIRLNTVPNINNNNDGGIGEQNNNFQTGGNDIVVSGNQNQNSFQQNDNGQNEKNGQSQQMPFQSFPSAFSNPFNTNNN